MIRLNHLVGFIATLVYCMIVANAGSGRMCSAPRLGQSALYYDIDTSGRILMIDYSKGRGRIVAKLDLSKATERPYGLQFIAGYFSENREETSFILMDSLFRTYTYSTNVGELRDAPIPQNPNYDYGVLPLAGDYFVIYLESLYGRVHILNASTNRVVRTLNVEKTLSINIEDVRFTRPGINAVLTIDGVSVGLVDLRSLKLLEAVDIVKMIPTASEPQFARVVATSKYGAVAVEIVRGRTGMRLYWIDLADLKHARILAQSDVLPLKLGRFRLGEEDGRSIVSCLGTEITNGEEEEVGWILQYMRCGDKIVQMDAKEYEPKKETALCNEKGELEIAPLVDLDYLSSLDLGAKVATSLPAIALKDYASHKARTDVLLKEYKDAYPKRAAEGAYRKLELIEK